MRPCQGRVGSSILPGRTRCLLLSSRGETDITAVFGTAIPGSNPGGSAKKVAYNTPHETISPCA
jgi:hypothetical protein